MPAAALVATPQELPAAGSGRLRPVSPPPSPASRNREPPPSLGSSPPLCPARLLCFVRAGRMTLLCLASLTEALIPASSAWANLTLSEGQPPIQRRVKPSFPAGLLLARPAYVQPPHQAGP